MIRSKIFLAAIAVSGVFAILNSAAFFVGVMRTPPGTEYLGTVHYWEDYFFYLNHFFQGANGAFLTANRYTPEPTVPTVIYWPNVLLGKIFGSIGIQPIIAYNLSLLILAFGSLMMSYFLLKKILGNQKTALIAFILSATATSLQNRILSAEGKMVFWPFQIWKTPHFAFDRLGGAPHQILLTLLVSVFLLLYLGRWPEKNPLRLFLLGLTASLISSIQLAQGAVTVVMLLSAEIINALIQKRIGKQTVLNLAAGLLPALLTAAYMYRLFNLAPHVQTKIWEASQHSYTNISFLIRSLGPVFFLAAIGIVTNIKKFTAIHWYGLLMIVSGYIMFLSKIPQTVGISNVRLLFPSTYVFWGLFAALGIRVIKGVRLQVIITVIFILISLPTLVWEIAQKTVSAKTEDQVVYLDSGVFDGLNKLREIGNFDDIALGNPVSRLDSLIPALSGHTSYSGHMLQTVDNAGKQAVAGKFFSRTLDPQTAAAWLKKERVRYVFFSAYDGDRKVFARYYGQILREIFASEQAAIFAVE